MLNKAKIKLKNRDINIRISLGNSNDLTGYGQEIERLTTFNSLDIVNPVVDDEVRRFTHINNDIITMWFLYHSPDTNTFVSDLSLIGFTFDELISSISSTVANSFYIVEFYDTFDRYSQTKLFTNHNSKMFEVGRRRRGDAISNRFTLNNLTEFYYLNIPVGYIESINTDTIIGYTKFLFYNAKTGNLITFYNADNASLTTDERYYFKTELDLRNFTWRFITPSITNDNRVNIREIERNRNQKFNERVNRTVDRKDNKTIIPPAGQAFDDETGTYFII